MIRRAIYRIRQFTNGVTAKISAGDQSILAETLTDAQRQLFDRMPVDAQRHSLSVLIELHKAGYKNADLAGAALLHDVGKVAARDAGAYLGLWLRGPMVITEKVAPALLTRLASSQPSTSWRYAVYVQNEHPQIGAKWAADVGCTALSCWLIKHHQHKQIEYIEPQKLALLKALQWADNRN